MQEVRVARGLTYSISSGFTRACHQGSFSIGSFTKTETTVELIRLVFDQLRDIRENGISEGQLMDAVNYLCGLYPLSIETCSGLAAKLAAIEFYGLPSDWMERYIPSLRSVGIGECKDAIDQYFPLRGYTTVIVGDVHGIKQDFEDLGTVEVRSLSLSDF